MTSGLVLAFGAVGAMGAAPPVLAAGRPHGQVPRLSTRTRATTPRPRADILKGPDGLQLLSQTPWVGPSQTEFRLRLRITASDQADEALNVIIYGALTARSEFQAALGGDVSGVYYPLPAPVPLGDLVADPAGGVDVDIPASNLSLATGVYPVQAFLEKDGVSVGEPLTTFLVYAGADAAHLERLDAGLVVPLVATVPINPLTGIPGPVPGPAASGLLADTSDLAQYHVPVTVQADVPTFQALTSGGPTDRLAVARLKSAVGSGDELLPSTTLPLDFPALVGSHLTNILQAELSSGSSALAAMLGSPPTLTTWAFNGGVDATSMAAAAALGAQQVAVPESDLSALPSQDQGLTFGWPTKLDVPGTEVEVIGADTELSARMTQAAAPGQAVLVANQVLAELAMIDLERPSDVRGVVLLPPAETVVDPTFLSVLLAGLRGDPLVRAATLADEFGTVPLGSSGANKPLVRRLDGPRSAAGLAGSGQLSEAFGALEEDGNVFGNSSLVSALGQQLTVSLSSVWSASQRSTMISGIVKAARAELAKIRLPPSISITLTSRQGKLPLTILSASPTPAHVRLVLSSQELSFVAQRFSEGACVPLNPENESCELTLTHPTTVVQVNVVVRAPGAFQLSLTLETPSGVTMVAGADTVRSTAISEVGLALMIGAALFLAVWWARNARHGRRAKKLVPRPPDEDSLADEGPLAGEGPLEGPTTVVDIPGPGRGVAAPAHRSPVAPPAVGKAGRLLGPAGGPPA